MVQKLSSACFSRLVFLVLSTKSVGRELDGRPCYRNGRLSRGFGLGTVQGVLILGRCLFWLLLPGLCVLGMVIPLCFGLLFPKCKELGVDFPLRLELWLLGGTSFPAEGLPSLYASG